MNRPKTTTRELTRSRKTRDDAMALRFIEELSWLLSGYQNLDFRKLADQIVTASRERHADVSTISDHISKNPNIPFLVGALPQLLDDSSIFPTNADIASFAEEVLILQVPRWQKKSKYEIIGHLVCSTYKLDDAKLSTLVSALTKLVSGDKRAKQIIEKKKDYESNWNEIIRQLSRVG